MNVEISNLELGLEFQTIIDHARKVHSDELETARKEGFTDDLTTLALCISAYKALWM